MQSYKTLKSVELENYLCLGDTTIRSALERLNSVVESFLIVVNTKKEVLGTLTDGDIRRSILHKNIRLDDLVTQCMKVGPIVGHVDCEADNLNKLWQLDLPRPFLPIICPDNSLVSVLVGAKLERKFDTAFILAGGLGKRLGQLTKNKPKPLLEVGGEPIISRIVEKLEQAGFRKIFISVHHFSDQFKLFFDKRDNTAAIQLIFEEVPLGTAGSLSLLPSNFDEQILVINGDVLTDANFDYLRDAHHQSGNHATIGAASFNIDVPFGVLKYDTDGEFQLIEEKPTKSYFVCAGLYCISPVFLGLLPKNQKLDMPDLINLGKNSGLKIGIFPIHEYWKDVGQPIDFYEAKRDFCD